MSEEGPYGEPLVTGGLHVGISGDQAMAQAHLRNARRLLGALRAAHGIDARIASGEPGGFFRRNVTMEDGTVITVASNNGQDSVRIAAPKRLQELETPTSTAEHRPASVPTLPGTHQRATPGQAVVLSHPVDQHQLRQPSEEEGEELADYAPYFWIGLRVVSPAPHPVYGSDHDIHACLWEPQGPGADPVILSNRNQFQDSDYDSAVYPLGRWTQFAGGVAYTNKRLFMLLPSNGYPMRAPDYDPATDEDVEWGVMFVSDSENDLGLLDGDGLPMRGIGDGVHHLKFMVRGYDCPETANPCTVEVRIVTGKNEHRRDISEQFVISEATTCLMGVMPFGWFNPPSDPTDPDPCYGANPHALHWWQGMAYINLAPQQFGRRPTELAIDDAWFTEPGETKLPPTGFDVGAWPDMCEEPPPDPPTKHWVTRRETTTCDYHFGFAYSIDDNWCATRTLTLKRRSFSAIHETVEVGVWNRTMHEYDWSTESSTSEYSETPWEMIFNETGYFCNITLYDYEPGGRFGQQDARRHEAWINDTCEFSEVITQYEY